MGIGVMGDAQTVRGFRLAGVHQARVLVRGEKEEALQAFRELQQAGVSVIVITRHASQAIRSELISAVREHPIPAVVEIPGSEKNTGAALIESVTSKAIGANIR